MSGILRARVRCAGATLLLLAIMAVPVGAERAAPPPEATTDAGLLVGRFSDGTAAFVGIPFAAPPLGPLRWRPPQPVQRWSGARMATAFGAACMQKPSTDNGVRSGPINEDCLTLNVWTGAGYHRAARPVMVWIHGGGLVNGSGSAALYDGAALARRGVVVVTLNYRLGRFGFFAHPALSRAAHGEGVGNYGLMDVIEALRWLKRNVRAFGGDPARVTVFGESAGGSLVNYLMVSPRARRLFARAIVESGGGGETLPLLSAPNRKGWPSAEQAGVAFAKGLGLGDTAADLAALRAAPADRILAGGDPNLFRGGGVIVDGALVPGEAGEQFGRGGEAKVPYVIGYNSVEFPSTHADVGLHLAYLGLSPDVLARTRTLYASTADQELNIVGDLVFAAPAARLARLHAANGAPAWLYRFGVVPTAMRETLLGTPHAQERQYVFQTFSASPFPTDANDHVQSNAVQDYWTSFAARGDPNTSSRPVWPRFGATPGRLLAFDNDGPTVLSIAPVVESLARSAPGKSSIP